jgi:hypothetical protein
MAACAPCRAGVEAGSLIPDKWGPNLMRILKILLVSTCLAAFGASAALAATTPVASTGQTKPKSTKVVKKKVVKKKVVKYKKTNKKIAKVTKTKPAPETETAPGSPPPGKTE